MSIVMSLGFLGDGGLSFTIMTPYVQEGLDLGPAGDSSHPG